MIAQVGQAPEKVALRRRDRLAQGEAAMDLPRRQPGVARSIEVLLAPEDLPVLRHPEPVKSSVPRN